MTRIFRKICHFGLARFCPVCGSSVRSFGKYGKPSRPDARCPVCGLMERHRLVWTYFKERTSLFDGKNRSMLHFAPEREFAAQWSKLPGLHYTSADLFDPRAMVRMDISAIDFPDETFDFFYCSHVLEHVPDDKKAVGQIYRVLKKGGCAVLLVPITAEETFEDPSVTDPQEREKLFGQADHVRRYGIDCAERFRQAGFTLNVVYASDLLSPGQKAKFGLNGLDEKRTPIFECRKI